MTKGLSLPPSPIQLVCAVMSVVDQKLAMILGESQTDLSDKLGFFAKEDSSSHI